MKQPIIQVMTHPFGQLNAEPRTVLEASGWDIRYNPYNRRLKACEVPDLVHDAWGMVAGTEPYTREVIEKSPNLRVIARVGVGFDNIDFTACRERDITVTYTPEAPADGVAELTVAQIINLLRHVHESDRSVREGVWNRFVGFLLREKKIGILGVGRIGKRVVKLLQPFQPQLYGCDLEPDLKFGEQYDMPWLSMNDLFSTCDLVSVHVPLSSSNIHLVGRHELQQMPEGGYLVNIARGKVVDEDVLLDLLRSGHLRGAALDVFEEEPYEGPLAKLPNVALTAHMGASARQSRFLMELGAAEDCMRVLRGDPPLHPITDDLLD